MQIRCLEKDNKKINIIVLTIVYGIQYNNVEVMKMDKAILDNLKSELKRGTQILSVLSLLDKNQYGYSLLQDLENKNVQIEAGTLYPLLRRLETQGILKSEWDTSESRPRKYYVLSNEGKEVYLELKEEWFRIVNEMNGILGGEIK